MFCSRSLSRGILVALLSSVPLVSQAQSPATIIVPAAGGGGADLIARVVAAELQPLLGQSVIVENRPGANSVIGISALTRAKPDGSTMLLVDRTTTAVNPARLKNLPYDPAALMGVSDVAKLDFLLVAGTDAPFSTWEEMVTYARANPGKVSLGSSGVGSGSHLSIELIAKEIGADLVHVPYKGMAPALQDVMGGVIDGLVAGPAVVLPQANSGKIRVIAQGSQERSPHFADVPTLKELGIQDQLLIPVTFTLFTPTGTPPDVVTKLNSALHQVIANPKIVERFDAMGLVAAGNQPADVARENEQLSQLLTPLIRELGIEE